MNRHFVSIKMPVILTLSFGDALIPAGPADHAQCMNRILNRARPIEKGETVEGIHLSQYTES